MIYSTSLHFLFLAFLFPIFSYSAIRFEVIQEAASSTQHSTADWWQNLCSDTGSCRERVGVY